MKLINKFRDSKIVFFALTWYIFLVSFPLVSYAGMAPSRFSREYSNLDKEENISSIKKMLENKLIQQRLKDYGFSPEEVNKHLSKMSAEDLHTLASISKRLPSGGDAADTLIVILIIVILVIIILKLMNKEVIIR